MWEEFKEFISGDDVLKMATGIIMGSAFTSIVNSLVDDIFMPLIVSLTGAADVTDLTITIGNTTIGIGLFLQAIINFLLISLFLFLVLKGIDKAKNLNKSAKVEEVEEAGPTKTELLTDILAELKKQN
ncbi:large conductance mechanosensitive channel protein MscL [Suicoccus acidiformans]|uniref:Large-conductance mechanosensitive channel n=1 Tax=Suicoccus acidiformans TaxID=2036206 RepID=A0A347WHN2_9LACT|nr:large conductance mechanosensitive channel protein MscL [Suicoccus acidiformans]AXY24589.1 large conductance mechanosensitive channel protein MscL [Suicoccus acidiformans]